MARTTSTLPTRQTPTLTALVATCATLALNGLVLGPMWLLTPTQLFSETAALPTFALSQRLSWLLMTVMIVLAPAILGRGPRRTPPAWCVPLVQLALAAQAATNYTMAFVAPWLAQAEPSLLDVPGGTFQVVTTAVWIGFIVAMVVLAVVLWRAGHSRVACVLVAVGAVGIPGVGPIGSGILATGLGVIALGQLRAARHEQPVRTPEHSLA